MKRKAISNPPIYVRTPQAFPVLVELPDGEKLLLFGSQVTYVDYYRSYGLSLFGLPPGLWLHIGLFLDPQPATALENTCHGLNELMQDEECWRLYCVEWLDKHPESGRLLASDALDVVRGPATALEENELQKLTFHWSWKQTAQQLVSPSAAAAASQVDFEEQSVSVGTTERPDMGFPPQLEPFSPTTLSQAKTVGLEPLLLRQDLSSYFQGDWSVDGLLRDFGSARCKVLLRIGVTSEFSMTLRNFVAYMRTTGDRVPLYLFESKLPPELSSRIVLPPLFEDNFLTELNDPAFSGRQWLLIGGAGSGLSFHVDPFGCSAWNALLQGRKRWALYPPDRVPPGVTARPMDDTVVYDSPPSVAWFNEVYPLLEANMRPLELIQEAGDIVFIPHGWWHCVVNLTETVAFTQNLITRCNVREAARQLQPFEPNFSDKLRRALLAQHSDD